MRRIHELWLRSPAPMASAHFVTTMLPRVGADDFADDFAEVRFSRSTPVAAGTADLLDPFWKFSVFADDIVTLASGLKANGHVVSEPVQFGDIGYLCHLEEPGGNAIELLQRTFRDSPRAAAARPDVLGLITLRVADVTASTRFYEQGLGMRLLSTMAIDDGRPDPFDLYFFGWIDEALPANDVASVANREWLYQRSSTLIELQHHRTPAALDARLSGATGLDHIAITVDDVATLAQELRAAGTSVVVGDGTIGFDSPDGHRFATTTT